VSVVVFVGGGRERVRGAADCLVSMLENADRECRALQASVHVRIRGGVVVGFGFIGS
jgi:hypothetical protein